MNKNKISEVIWQSGYIEDKNAVKRIAKFEQRELIASGFIGILKHKDKKFDEAQFLKDCGLN